MRFNFKAIGVTALLFGAPTLASPAPQPELEFVEPRGNVPSVIIGGTGLVCAVWTLQYNYRNGINKDAAADIHRAFTLESGRLKEVTKKYREAAKDKAPKVISQMEGYETQISNLERAYASAIAKVAGDNKKQKEVALKHFQDLERIGKSVERGCNDIAKSAPKPPPPSKKRPGKRSVQRRRVARAVPFAA
ncbi:hypothetical protein MAPG_03548 [Magnaporthiopsis poae ATCC 64411]|uniref:Fungal N-terminal domain-containing protein n=1 Tax=Magnaporthiopsis poae (strain ATCC 64411 / 73-15) TaxID=644358 RepID=A0A0C4DUB1_MAGP6|nr:hypothetical protein MAPG_03548 [Magnaporthiopsis poae ATCC 64411]